MIAATEHGRTVADEVSSDVMMRREPTMTKDLALRGRDSQVRRAPNSEALRCVGPDPR
jgi:hypothetical protein